MKHFEFTFVPNKTDHPVKGAVALLGYVQSHSQDEAKTEARRQLREMLDPENCMCYKPVRLKEITEALYLAATQTEIPAHPEADITLMCIAMYGEYPAYDEEERRSALELLDTPEDEPDTYAAYLALCGSNALTAEVKPDLSPDAVDNHADSLGAVAAGQAGAEVVGLVNNSPQSDDRTSENTRDYPHDNRSLETEIACALWPDAVDANRVPGDVLRWAKNKIARREEDLVSWSVALNKVPDIQACSRPLIFDVVRSVADRDIYRDPVALDAHIAQWLLADEAAIGADFVDEDEGDREVPDNTLPPADNAAAPAFLHTLTLPNGGIENGEGYNSGRACLNATLADIPCGGSLVVYGLRNDLYHACDGYSSTQLRLVQTGGTAALEWYKSAPRDDSNAPALSLGSAVHAALLEPAVFAVEYCCAPAVNLRTNDGKAELAAFEAQCAAKGVTVLKADDYRKVGLMRDSALAQPVIAALLQRGMAELSVFYRTEQGVLLKVRPDWFGELGGAPFLMDVKTTDKFQDFGKSVEEYGYHVQAAFYSRVMAAVFGIEVDFAFCVLGKSLACGRYPVSLGVLEDVDFDEGLLQVQALITQLETCDRDGFSADLGTIARPWWARLADKRRRDAQEVMA